MTDDVQRDLGRLEARADSTDERLERIEAKVDQLIDCIAQNKGGIRTLLAVGSLAATAGAAIAETLHWVHR